LIDYADNNNLQEHNIESVLYTRPHKKVKKMPFSGGHTEGFGKEERSYLDKQIEIARKAREEMMANNPNNTC
jgi:hypothetical protein